MFVIGGHPADPQLRRPGSCCRVFLLGVNEEHSVLRINTRSAGQNLRSYWNVTPDTLSRVWEDTEHAADIFIATNGGHSEIY